MQFLKVSTAATVHVGVLVDATNGVTPEDGITTGSADVVEVYKSGAAGATDIKGSTTFTNVANGVYTLTLSTGDTGTVGRLVLFIIETATMRPFRMEFTVLPAKVYDSLVGGSDNLEVDSVQWLGNAVTVDANNLPDVNIEAISEDLTAATNLESYCDGNANMPIDVFKISGSATAADNLELYTTGADRIMTHVQEIEPTLDFSSTMKTALEAAVANKLNAAIPGGPTANSINQRMVAIDDLTQASGAGDLAAILLDTGTNGVQLDLTQSLNEAPTATTLGAAFFYPMASVFHRVVRTGTDVVTYRSNASTVSWTRALDSATNPSSLTPS